MDLTPVLKKLYPEGSVQGECGNFCHRLSDFGMVGDTYASKKAFVRLNGIIAANIYEVARGFRVGDVVVTSEGTFMGMGTGHVAFIAQLINGQPYAAESNFRKDGKVHYGRPIPISKIYGIIRAPLKVDLGVCEVNYSVFINNQPPWGLRVLDDLKAHIFQITGQKLVVNFFPLRTSFNNWWYDTQYNQLTGQFNKIIAKAYLNGIAPQAQTNLNKPADVFAFVVRPDQWEGEVFGRQNLTELGWCDSYTRPAQIQLSCAEFDLSPTYAGFRMINHGLTHELAHFLYYMNGMDDKTHFYDNPGTKGLDKVYSEIDWNRITANL